MSPQETGGTTNMKNIQNISDQLNLDDPWRKAFVKYVSSLNEETKQTLLYCYTDSALHDIYEGLRNEAKINKNSKSKVHRRIIKFPNMIVYTFLNDLFIPIYGEDWLTDKKTLRKVILREELIKPWIVGEL
jgi:hypothetical protein